MAKVGNCEKFIKGIHHLYALIRRVIVLTRVTGDMF